MAGAILGVALDRMINTDATIELAGLTLLCVVVVALFVMVREHDDTVDRLERNIALLRDQFGVTVDCQLLKDVNARHSTREDPVSQVMMEAQHEILVVDLIPASGIRSDWSMRSDLARSHLQSVLDRVKEVPGEIAYRRVCQVQTFTQPLARVQDDVFREHCIETLGLKAQIGTCVSLKISPVVYPYKFFIVDRQVLILQLNSIGENGVFAMERELIIRDPGGELVSVFLELWNELVEHPGTRSVVRGEFSPAH